MVSTLKDFTDCDENFEQTCNPMSDIDFSLAVDHVDVKSLESFGFSIVRNSRDKIVNQNVKDLLMFVDIVILLSLKVDQKVFITGNAHAKKLVLSLIIIIN